MRSLLFILFFVFSYNAKAVDKTIEASQVNGILHAQDFVKNGHFDFNITKNVTCTGSGGVSGSCTRVTSDKIRGGALRLSGTTTTSLSNTRTQTASLDLEPISVVGSLSSSCYITGWARMNLTCTNCTYLTRIKYTVNSVTTTYSVGAPIGGSWGQFSIPVDCGNSADSSRLVAAELSVTNTLAGAQRQAQMDFDEIKLVMHDGPNVKSYIPSPYIGQFTGSATGVVSDSSLQDMVNGDGVVSDTSLFTYTFQTSFWKTTPFCWAELTTDASATSASAMMTSVSTTTAVVRTLGSGAKTALAHRVICVGGR